MMGRLRVHRVRRSFSVWMAAVVPACGVCVCIVRAPGRCLVLPSEDVGDLLSERKRIEGLEQNCSDAEIGEATLIDALYLCGEQEDGDVGDGRDGLHVAEGGRTVDAGHHDVHEDGVRALRRGDGDSFGAGAAP